MTAEALSLFVEDQNLAAVVRRYIKTNSLSITELANRSGINRSVLSKYLSNSYDGNIASIEQLLGDYLAENGVVFDGQTVRSSVPLKTVFFESGDARGVTGVCSSCQEFLGLGIVVGRSGFGKSHTLRQYTTLPRTAYVECDGTMSTNDLIEAVERSLGMPVGNGTVWKRLDGICGFLNVNGGYLLIIDEADKLIDKSNIKKMELLRTIVDKADVGMVVAGEPALEGALKSGLPRMANRVDFYYNLRGLTKEEVSRYLSAFPFEPQALAEMQERAVNHRFGCFRLLDRTLNNVLRLMREEGVTSIDGRMIAQASAMMML